MNSSNTVAPTELAGALQNKIDRKTKPPGSLGRLEELALQLGRIQNDLAPEIRSPVMLVFAGDHGATEAGISPYPKEVTAQMVHNFLNGGAAINVFARQNDLPLLVVDAGVDAEFPEALRAPLDDAAFVFATDAPQAPRRVFDAKVRRGTRNFVEADALSEDELNQCMDRGARIIESLSREGVNAVGFGEMGIGNTSAASLLQSVLSDRPLADCVGRGTGHTDEGLRHKTAILTRALERFRQAQPPADEVDLARAALRAFGGLEIAMMTGAMLAAAERGILIVVDGYITTAATMAAVAMDPRVREHCVFSHVSGEQGHRAMLDRLDARPLLDLSLRLGEGTGAALAFPIILAATKFLAEMASFEDAGVSDRESNS